MKDINFDSIPHLSYCAFRLAYSRWYTWYARLACNWWGIRLGSGATFVGRPRFKRHPGSQIVIGSNCRFNSSSVSNLIGVNRPCMISTLKEGARISIDQGCGFSGTVIASAKNITIGKNVRCGANTLITDTDWHNDDPRVGPDKEVHICDDVWLGVNVIVLKGVTIGKGALVGAGSIVCHSLPPGVTAVGSPARVIRRHSSLDDDKV